jgi:hypothetical protein
MLKSAAGRSSPVLSVTRQELGRGRSGFVYLDREEDGRVVAAKVFYASGLTKLVQWIFLGAPNPYMWSADAVRAAYLRRAILSELVQHWFGDQLRVARPRSVRRDEASRAYELRCDFIDGRAPELHHPLRSEGRDEARELAHAILEPLQERLIASGFDGIVWQAGKSNPVALNNFLVDRTGAARWAWIDLESGVPALFPWNPWTLLTYYLPRSLRHRAFLFDDVDAQRLAGYLAHEDALTEKEREHLLGLGAELERRQRGWRGMRRFERSIAYRLAGGDIDDEQAAWFRSHPLAWYGRETTRGLRAAGRKSIAAARLIYARVRGLPVRRFARGSARFLVSQRYRSFLAQRYVARRILSWRRRGQMSLPDARFLRSHLRSEESSAYLTDFGVHIAIKPFVKLIEFWVFPALYAFGAIGEGLLAAVLLGAGATARTLYTLGRMAQASAQGHERPWVALGVGLLPVLGNFAYPLQIAYSSTEEEDDLARFILYDGCTRIGAHLPIWGGNDTWTEHLFNRLPDRLGRLRPRVARHPATGEASKTLHPTAPPREPRRAGSDDEGSGRVPGKQAIDHVDR